MTATECDRCGETWAYDRVRCPSCAGESFSPVELGRGELVATTVAHVTPPACANRIRLGVARFGGMMVTAQLAEESLSVGDAVVLDGEYPLRDENVVPESNRSDAIRRRRRTDPTPRTFLPPFREDVQRFRSSRYFERHLASFSVREVQTHGTCGREPESEQHVTACGVETEPDEDETEDPEVPVDIVVLYFHDVVERDANRLLVTNYVEGVRSTRERPAVAERERLTMRSSIPSNVPSVFIMRQK